MNIREMPWFEMPGARLKRSGPEAILGKFTKSQQQMGE
jgi:hypothetical protein